jgi:hypothetical protein
MDLSKVNRREGKSKRFDNIANNSVPETSAPRATVPPKFETTKTENPKNNTIDV